MRQTVFIVLLAVTLCSCGTGAGSSETGVDSTMTTGGSSMGGANMDTTMNTGISPNGYSMSNPGDTGQGVTRSRGDSTQGAYNSADRSARDSIR